MLESEVIANAPNPKLYDSFADYMADAELNEDSLEAMRETEEMEKHPERYRVYTDVNEMMQDFLK